MRRDKVSPLGRLPRTLVEVNITAVLVGKARPTRGYDWTHAYEDMLTHGANVRLVMDAVELGHCQAIGAIRCNYPSVRDEDGKLRFNGWCMRHAHLHPRWPDAKTKVPPSEQGQIRKLAVFRGLPIKEYERGKRPPLSAEEAGRRAEELLTEWLRLHAIGHDGVSPVL